jgi:hypothetical protein
MSHSNNIYFSFGEVRVFETCFSCQPSSSFAIAVYCRDIAESVRQGHGRLRERALRERLFDVTCQAEGSRLRSESNQTLILRFSISTLARKDQGKSHRPTVYLLASPETAEDSLNVSLSKASISFIVKFIESAKKTFRARRWERRRWRNWRAVLLSCFSELGPISEVSQICNRPAA